MSEQNSQDNQPQFALQRIYVKDVSFESPKSPDLFKEQWTPEVSLDLNTLNKKLDEKDMFEVILSLTVTVKSGKETAFVAEVKQAGIFLISNIPQESIPRSLGAFCPNILFPYAREAIDNLVVRGSFPPIMLAPVNFDALFDQAEQQSENEKETIQ